MSIEEIVRPPAKAKLQMRRGPTAAFRDIALKISTLRLTN
jgi:hypothetical protein